MSRGAAGRTGARDHKAVLAFLDDVRDLDLDVAYTVGLLARLQSVVACDAVLWHHADLREQQFYGLIGYTPGVPEGGADDEAVYWAASPCPVTEYRERTGDVTAVRMSDVIGARRYHELPIYRYYHTFGLEQLMDLGLAADPRHYRSIAFFRGGDGPDFSERDRDVLELLRPHLRAREARAELYRRLSGDPLAADADQPANDGALTLREREIVYLVGQGKSNAEIAAQLWISPTTVKKHLEHVYEKLGVSGRAAAAGRLRAVSPASMDFLAAN